MADRFEARRRRPLYGPPPRARRSTLGYWVPLVLTVTIATAGLVAWVWSERQDSEETGELTSDEEGKPPDEAREALPGAHQQGNHPSADVSRAANDDGTFMGRIAGSVRRAPSTQQIFDRAGRTLQAGIAAAGAIVGGALGSVRDEAEASEERVQPIEGDEGFSDHERWSEEAVSQRVEMQDQTSEVEKRAGPNGRESGKSKSKKTVAVVICAEDDGEYSNDHTSILSHLQQHIDSRTTRLFVLIYAPYLASVPFGAGPEASIPQTTVYDALHAQAAAMVEKPTMILPFTTPTGYVHLLRHLAPNFVYVSDTEVLAGDKGENIRQLRGWVGQTVVVVGDHTYSDLVDTETEDQGGRRQETRKGWWEDSEMVGLGKGFEIVNADRVGDDWTRRIGP